MNNETVGTFVGVVNDVKYVVLAGLALAASALGLWKLQSKTQTTVFGDTVDRRRITEAMDAEKKAKDELHEMSNKMMAMMGRLGRLEAQVENYETRIAELENENDLLIQEVAGLRGEPVVAFRRRTSAVIKKDDAT